MSRRQEILNAVDKMIAAHDEWSDDKQATNEPSEKLGVSLELAYATCHSGDTPENCFELHGAIAKLNMEWEKYNNGHWRVMQRPGENPLYVPHDSLWAAFRGVVDSRKESKIPEPTKLESVRALIQDQKCTPMHVARIYGWTETAANDRLIWKGPFFTKNSTPDIELIEKEEKEPGSVIPKGWVNPAEQRLIEQQRESLKHKLQALDDEQEDADHLDRPPVESVEAMGRDGATVQQIMSVCNLGYDSVVARLRKAGIEPVDHRDPSTYRAPHEQQITDAENLAMPSTPPSNSEPETEEEEPATTVSNSPTWRVQDVYDLFDAGHKPGEIARKLGITTQKASSILKKRPMAEAVPESE